MKNKTLSAEALKEQVRQYWDSKSCGVEFSSAPKFSKEYYQQIEQHRYRVEPEIPIFAQFPLFRGKTILEVGIGAGTDFVQWIRNGAKAYGLDLTAESITHVRQRLELNNLTAEDLQVADCESIPYPDNTFDLVYSWGVIHHTPDTAKALREILRVLKPGATAKLMVYQRHSLVAYRLWVVHALLAGKPFRSLSDCVYHHMESIGTKAYTVREMKAMLSPLDIHDVSVAPVLTYYDVVAMRKNLLHKIVKFLSPLLGGNRRGWFLLVEFKKS